MNDSRIDASFNAPASDNRRALSSQSQRRQWEAAWLDQHRGAFDVIEHEHGDGATAGSARVEPIKNGPLVERASEQGECAMKPAHGLPQESSHARAGVNLSLRARPDSAHRLFQDLPTLAALKLPNHPLSDGGAPKTESSPATASPTSASPMSRAMPPSAVLWLEGESVRSAMRLKDPARTGETLAALREWLRDAGLWLREAWVNGRIAFKSGRDHGN